MSQRRIGVYVCQCGGNISDYVDVERVASQAADNADVVIARTAMFTCSDATQADIAEDIRQHQLDGLVVASCSPKLHTLTFRGVAERAGLNPYQYTQVNLREQCSWAHTDDRKGATDKAVTLVEAGIGRTRLTEPLNPLVVDTMPKALVIGAGITGMRAAVGLADLGMEVYLVEKQATVGGWLKSMDTMYPAGKTPKEIIDQLDEQIHQRSNVTVFTEAEVVQKGGTFGNYVVKVALHRPTEQTISLNVGSIIVATGFDVYQPEIGQYGYGIDGVLTLPEFQDFLKTNPGPMVYHGRPVRTVSYIYCVGSREGREQPNAHTYCSRYCCTSTVHTALEVFKHDPGVHQYHLYRDVRTYGKYELLYSESREKGSLYLKFAADQPPAVERTGDQLKVTVNDLLTSRKELAIPSDLVVLVTGIIPRENDALVHALKLPVGKDGFYNEIHPKLRPVETVVDGVYIAGACQNPKTAGESAASALAAVTQSASILKKGKVQLDPQVAFIDASECTGCGACLKVCPYEAISAQSGDNGQSAYVVSEAICKGCGGCVPECPVEAIRVQGYTNAEIRAMIDGLLMEEVEQI